MRGGADPGLGTRRPTGAPSQPKIILFGFHASKMGNTRKAESCPAGRPNVTV